MKDKYDIQNLRTYTEDELNSQDNSYSINRDRMVVGFITTYAISAYYD